MSTVQEIEDAIRELPQYELGKLLAFIVQLKNGEQCGPGASDEEDDRRLEEMREKARQAFEAITEATQSLSTGAAAFAPPNQGSYPPSVIEPAKIQDRDEWLKAFNEWVDSHHDITAIADDSRDSIYEGRGE
jgi:hypothetical protein